MKNSDKLIAKENIDICSEKLPDVVFDNSVDVHLVRKYFTNEAWLLI